MRGGAASPCCFARAPATAWNDAEFPLHETTMMFFTPAPACDSRGTLNLVGLCDTSGVPLDPFLTSRGKRLEFEALHYEAVESGGAHDWNWGFGLVPVIRASVAETLERTFGADVQCIPVKVPSKREEFVLMNIVTVRDCVDEVRSQSRRVQPGESAPEHVGKFRDLGCLTIDEARVGGADIFRLRDAEGSAVVSERVRDLALRHRWTGIEFLRTYDGCPPGIVGHRSMLDRRNVQ